MRVLLFVASLVVVVFLVVDAVQLGFDKRENPELYGYRVGSYEAYQQTIRPVTNTGDFFRVDITEPLILNLTFEQFQAEVVEHNRLADVHYREFISMKFYLLLLSLAVWLTLRNIDLELDNAQLAKKLEKKDEEVGK